MSVAPRRFGKSMAADMLSAHYDCCEDAAIEIKVGCDVIDKIADWRLQITQILLPLLLIPVVILLDIPTQITEILIKAKVKVKDLDTIWRIAIGLGKWPLIVVALFFIYRAIRRHNKEEILKQNLSVIVWHSFLGYWFCRYILNYQTISLTRVPIPVQFELVWKNLFRKYEYMDGVTEKTESETLNVEILQAEPYTSTINLILADTYPLDGWKAKIPASVTSYSTIIVNRSGERGVRYYSKDFVARIASIVHELPNTVLKINVFATLNAAHVYHIVNEVFKTGGRDGIKQIIIYEQTKDSWVFEGKKYKVIKIGA